MYLMILLYQHLIRLRRTRRNNHLVLFLKQNKIKNRKNQIQNLIKNLN